MDNLVQLMKAFNNETRLRMLIVLSRKQLCVCELQGILDKTQPQISKQLAVLKELGVVSDVKKDKFVYYSLLDDSIIQSLIVSILKNIDEYPQISVDLENCNNSHIYREGKC